MKGGININNSFWILCPICKNKTRTKMLQDTTAIKLPIYCPKCKQENLVNVKNFKVTIIKEPDAKTQSQ
ncbi:conjugal transfer protein [Listeria monocytogenes]|nr:conjugal transfer protein [Listeria monocytogenes]